MRTVSLDRLKSLLRYDPEEGAFYWLVHRSNVRAGDRAGSLSKQSVAADKAFGEFARAA